jgi:serine/threonine-protein kinase
VPDKRWRRVKDVFGGALERPAEARAAFLGAACGGDDGLRREVESLLDARQAAGDFLSRPARPHEDGPPSGAPGRSWGDGAARVASGTRLGPYEVVSFLGAGGMGEVYKARDTRLDRTVAIKVLPAAAAVHPDLHRRFEREARTVSQLSHPHICALFDVGQHDGSSFLVMEYLEGENLAQRLRRGPLLLEEALGHGLQVAEALEEAHQHGVVHRDLKPANVVLTKKGATLLDFGIAKLRSTMPAEDESVRSRPLTGEGLVVGTLPYMAPEQLEGRAVDERTDVFAFGLVLYEMVSGRQAFEAPSGPGLIAAILRCEPPPLSRVQPLTPPPLEAIVQRCLAKDPADRWPTAGELVSALRRLAGGPGASAWTQPAPSVVGRIRRHKKGVTLALALALGIAGLGPALHRRAAPGKAVDSIAVLPLANAMNDADMDYLADGVTESIINSLSHLPQLRVMARSTVFTYKGRSVDPRRVGADLNVRAVLTGRVLQQGERLIVAAELVDARDGSRLWGEQYDRKLSDIFAVQDEIAREIAANLRLRLTGEQEQRLTKRYTGNAEAYRLYMKGRYFWNKRTEEGIKKGIEHFERAIEKDPGYALAHAGLADSYIVLGIWDILPPKETYPVAKTAAMKALELDDRLAEAHTALAAADMYLDRDVVAAEGEFKRAIELNPNYPLAHLWYAILLNATKRPEAALAESNRSQELDPFSLIVNVVSGWNDYVARRPDEGMDRVEKTREMDANFWPARWYLGVFYEERRMYPEAIAEYKKAVDLSGGLTRTIASLGHAYAVAGQPERAQAVLAELKQLSARHYVASYSVAQIYAGLGDKDRALEWLGRALEERHGWLILLGVDPDFDLLRSDPRFVELLRRVGLQRFWT